MVGVEQVTRREWSWALVAAACIVALASLPYVVAWLVTPTGYQYSGLLINPLDGLSYLAKMGQGAGGAWLFRLPFTSEAHEPVLIYTHYLALGHLAPGGSPVKLVGIYHLTRVLAGFALLVAVYGAAAVVTPEIRQRRLILLFVGLSSGMGWLTGGAPDLAVPEAITFPSLLVNAHFGLTMLLMLLLIFGITLAGASRGWWVIAVVGGGCLTMIQPYAVPVVGLSAGSWVLLQRVRERRWPRISLGRLLVFGMTALPLLLYFLWVTRTNPRIGAWMAQNVTPSPPIGQWLVGYGLLGPLAAAGVWQLARHSSPAGRLLLCWLGAQLGMMLLPIALQRRLSTGLHMPLAFLAAIGWYQVVLLRRSARRFKLMTTGLLLIAFPSNLLLMLAGVSAVADRNPHLVMTDAQWEAMTWLRENIPPETVVLADEDLGALVPAWGGGARVVYGHPFETLNAQVRLSEINDFYSGVMTADEQIDFLRRFGVQIVIVQGDDLLLPPQLETLRYSDPITIYRVAGM